MFYMRLTGFIDLKQPNPTLNIPSRLLLQKLFLVVRHVTNLTILSGNYSEKFFEEKIIRNILKYIKIWHP